MKVFVAIDVEATGENLLRTWVPCFAACAITEGGKMIGHYEAYPNEPEDKVWGKRCLDEFWNAPQEDGGPTVMEAFKKRKLGKKTETLGESVLRFVNWCADIEGDVTLVSDTSDFDFTRLNYMLSMFSSFTGVSVVNRLFGRDYQPSMCIDDYMKGAALQIKHWGADEAFLGLLGLTEYPECVQPVDRNHDPLEDAKRIAQIAAFVARQSKHLLEQSKKRQRSPDGVSVVPCAQEVAQL